jgi:hypothetical protein
VLYGKFNLIFKKAFSLQYIDMTNNQNIGSVELYELRKNFKNLDYISKKLLTDIYNKNEILQNGLTDCKVCETKVDNNNKRTKQQKQNQ